MGLTTRCTLISPIFSRPITAPPPVLLTPKARCYSVSHTKKSGPAMRQGLSTSTINTGTLRGRLRPSGPSPTPPRPGPARRGAPAERRALFQWCGAQRHSATCRIRGARAAALRRSRADGRGRRTRQRRRVRRRRPSGRRSSAAHQHPPLPSSIIMIALSVARGPHHLRTLWYMNLNSV